MKRNTSIAIALLTAWASGAALAQVTTNSTRGLDWNAFRSIGDNNIFSPTRSMGPDDAVEVRHIPVIRGFTYSGTVDDRAIFKGEGAPEGGLFKTGDTINGFKVTQVNVDFVKLADPDGNLVMLEPDDSMRRADQGPWTKSDQPAPLTVSAAAPPETGSGSATVSSAADAATGPANESDILKKLRLKREQEDK